MAFHSSMLVPSVLLGRSARETLGKANEQDRSLARHPYFFLWIAMSNE